MYEAHVFFVYIHHGVITICLFGLAGSKKEKDMGAFMLIIVFGIAAMAANFFLRHQFGKKYPEVDSGQVISLAVVQIATIVYFFVSIFGIMGIGAEAYLYNRPISEAEDDAMGLYAISSLLGGIVMTVVSILLCYKIFNFPKNNKKQISTLAITNTIVASVVCIIHIISSFALNTYGILICAIIIIGTLVYFQRPFTSAVERMYRSKYNESIQSIVVKNITKIAENTSPSYHSAQSPTPSRPTEETKRCPYCGEIILAVAKKCKHCGEWLKEEPKEYIRCSVCGEKVEKGQEKCPLCNEPLHPSRIGIDAEETYKPCIICGEQILSVAKKCKHCGEWQNQAMPKTMIKCSICGEDTDASLEICPHCGEKLSEMSNQYFANMEETKKCPYCGEEILAVAKKCKHCGEWLDGREDISVANETLPPKNETPTIDDQDRKSIGGSIRKGCFYVLLGAFVLCAGSAILGTCSNNKEQKGSSASVESAFSDLANTSNLPSASEVENVAAKLGLEKDGDDKLSEAILYIASDGKTVIATSDDKVYYLSNSDSDDVYDSEGANCGKIGIYDVNNRTTSFERIRTPSGEPYNINSYNFADDKITFVLVDVGRNGFGTGNFITNVSQYNIKTGKWKTIAEGCADAKFTDDRNYVIITTAEITNYDEAESALEYKYDYSTNRIKL